MAQAARESVNLLKAKRSLGILQGSTKALRISEYFNNNNSMQKRSMLLVVGYLLGPFHTFLANYHN